MFVGDLLYPFTAIYLDGVGSNVSEYVSSINKLRQFVLHLSNSSNPQQEIIQEFFASVGLDTRSASAIFNAEGLMDICDWNIEAAVDFYLNNSTEISLICPPVASHTSTDAVKLSCGHVESNLASVALEEIHEFMEILRSGVLSPTHIDGEFGEFSNGAFTVMMPLKPKWNA